jgi:hypothetical protein
MQDYALCVRPLCPFLHPLRVTHMGLAWEGSPVASQRSYGGLNERSTCVQQSVKTLELHCDFRQYVVAQQYRLSEKRYRLSDG